MDVEPKIGFFSPRNGWFISWKTLLKWMIWGYPYFWKHPYYSYVCSKMACRAGTFLIAYGLKKNNPWLAAGSCHCLFSHLQCWLYKVWKCPKNCPLIKPDVHKMPWSFCDPLVSEELKKNKAVSRLCCVSRSQRKLRRMMCRQRRCSRISEYRAPALIGADAGSL